MVRIEIDAFRCQGHGRCYGLTPELFDADDQGHGLVLVPHAEGDTAERARMAAANCPEEAVIVSDEE